MEYLLFLQNAWSPVYAGTEWPRPSWLRALAASRSGKRLSVMIDDFDLCENTTPICGATPDSVIPPDAKHILATIKRRKPSMLIACGKQAEAALLELWRGPLLIVPHPAHRLLTDKLYQEARMYLDGGLDCVMALRQIRGSVITHRL